MREIRNLFERENLQILGVTDAEPLIVEEKEFNGWIACGYHGTMDYLKRHTGKKFRPEEILPGCKTLVFTGLSYFQPRTGVLRGHGTVARYAWGRDYHKVLGKRLKRLAASLREIFQEERFFSFVDSTPLAERPFAERAGVGFTGRNTLLIRRGFGSWFVIGGIATTLEIDAALIEPERTTNGPENGSIQDALPMDARPQECYGQASAWDIGGRSSGSQSNTRRNGGSQDGCPPGCRRCIDACPTGALFEPHRIDARKCISYLTIEHRGFLDDDQASAIGNRIFGCDICQEVCPFNRGVETTYVADFLSPRAGPSLSLESVLSIKNNAEFLERFAGSPLMRAKRSGLVRNACVCAANLGLTDLLPQLKILLDDSDHVIARQAAWAVGKLLKGNRAGT